MVSVCVSYDSVSNVFCCRCPASGGTVSSAMVRPSIRVEGGASNSKYVRSPQNAKQLYKDHRWCHNDRCRSPSTRGCEYIMPHLLFHDVWTFTDRIREFCHKFSDTRNAYQLSSLLTPQGYELWGKCTRRCLRVPISRKHVHISIFIAQ